MGSWGVFWKKDVTENNDRCCLLGLPSLGCVTFTLRMLSQYQKKMCAPFLRRRLVARCTARSRPGRCSLLQAYVGVNVEEIKTAKNQFICLSTSGSDTCNNLFFFLQPLTVYVPPCAFLLTAHSVLRTAHNGHRMSCILK